MLTFPPKDLSLSVIYDFLKLDGVTCNSFASILTTPSLLLWTQCQRKLVLHSACQVTAIRASSSNSINTQREVLFCFSDQWLETSVPSSGRMSDDWQRFEKDWRDGDYRNRSLILSALSQLFKLGSCNSTLGYNVELDFLIPDDNTSNFHY